MKTEPAVPAEVLAAIRAPLASSGALPVTPPLLQPLTMLLDAAGEDMRARLFVVQAEGGAEVCLRPDFTVAVAGVHIAAGGGQGSYLYEGPCFRAAPPSSIEAEEFVQIGVETFYSRVPPQITTGNPLPVRESLDAAVASLAWRASEAGGRKDLSLWLGDVGLIHAFIDTLELAESLSNRLWRAMSKPRLLEAELARAGEPAAQPPESQLATLLAGRSEQDAAAMLEEVWLLAGIEPVGGRGPAEIAQRLMRRAKAAAAPALTVQQAETVRALIAISGPPAEALEQVRSLAGERMRLLEPVLASWSRRLTDLDVPADRLRLAPALGHAFDYYDGITFEVRSDALGPERPVAVGGRYDLLLTRLGGGLGAQAVGCMVRPWRAFAGGEA